MTRGNDPGKDFDDLWNSSKRRASYRADRGEGPYSTDKYLERVNRTPRPAHHAGQKSCAVLAALLGGIGWAVSEVVSRAL